MTFPEIIDYFLNELFVLENQLIILHINNDLIILGYSANIAESPA